MIHNLGSLRGTAKTITRMHCYSCLSRNKRVSVKSVPLDNGGLNVYSVAYYNSIAQIDAEKRTYATPDRAVSEHITAGLHKVRSWLEDLTLSR